MIFVYKIADIVFGADLNYKYTYKIMKDFLASENSEPEFTISVTDEELEAEKKSDVHDFPKYAYESTAIYRKFIYVMIEKYNAFFFHCSAISVDGQAILFTANSGTGKSTHRRLWQKNFGDKVTVINDDKPIIRKQGDLYYAYGTPWCGKEGLGSNIKAPIKALCFLSRDEKNSITPVKSNEPIILRLFEQTLLPSDKSLMSNLLEMFDGFLNQADIYNLRVNMEDEAAIMAYKKICAEDF